MAIAVPFTGGCACGAIRFQCSAAPSVSYFCHCRDCQRESGSAFTSCVVVPAAAFAVTQGNPKHYDTTSDSGGSTRRCFCPNCGAPLHGCIPTAPDVVTVNVASLDDPSGFEPQMSLWVSSAQPWTHLNPVLPKLDTQPAEEEVQRMFSGKS